VTVRPSVCEPRRIRRCASLDAQVRAERVALRTRGRCRGNRNPVVPDLDPSAPSSMSILGRSIRSSCSPPLTASPGARPRPVSRRSPWPATAPRWAATSAHEPRHAKIGSSIEMRWVAYVRLVRPVRARGRARAAQVVAAQDDSRTSREPRHAKMSNEGTSRRSCRRPRRSRSAPRSSPLCSAGPPRICTPQRDAISTAIARPSATALITVEGPRATSPPANTQGTDVSPVRPSARMVPSRFRSTSSSLRDVGGRAVIELRGRVSRGGSRPLRT
jgi:hypothetical protein